MHQPIDLDDAFDVVNLHDALAIGLDLQELFGPQPLCALWLGDDTGAVLDFVLLTEHRGRDVDHLVWYASVTAHIDHGIERAVLWRTVDDITDVPELARQFFHRRDRLEADGLTLVDEIALSDEELRSLAVTTLSDEPDWDDVTHLLGATGDEA